MNPGRAKPGSGMLVVGESAPSVNARRNLDVVDASSENSVLDSAKRFSDADTVSELTRGERTRGDVLRGDGHTEPLSRRTAERGLEGERVRGEIGEVMIGAASRC